MIKGALHVHSSVSPDSVLSLTFLKDLFKRKGYQFILLTDHAEDLDHESYEKLKRECASLSDDSFLMIPGLEIKWHDKVHLLAYGARSYIGNENSRSIQDTINAIRKTTMCDLLVWGHVNNPVRLDNELLAAARLIDGIEIFNISYHGFILPDAKGLFSVERLREIKPSILALGGLDMHRKIGYDKMVCLIKDTELLSRDEIFNCLKNGLAVYKGRIFTLQSKSGKYSIFLKISARCVNNATYFFKKVCNKIRRLFYGIN